MPLARITTPLPEYFERLAQDLRARGFDVETASPGQFFSGAADLEITVKQCEPGDAAKMAGEASLTKDMCVLVTPGAKDGSIRSIEMIVLQPNAEAAQAVRHRMTPAQVIEISSALMDSNEPRPLQSQSKVEGKLKNWPAVKSRARSSWSEIARTTTQWLESATAGCQAGWEAAKQSVVPAKAFLLEVGEETKKLGRRIAVAVVSRGRGKRLRKQDDEQLVPSMFDLSGDREFGDRELNHETEVVDEETPVVEISGHRAGRAAGRDKRFWKAAGAAAVAAVAVLAAVSVLHRPPHVPAVAGESQVENKAALPASASLKPSVIVERGGQKNPAGSGVQVLAAKQVMGGDSQAEDTVVRYGSRPTAPKRTVSHPQIKRYSDLD
jgi:hypothetical protein